MKKLFTLCLLIVSLSASAQWQQTGSKVRYVNGLGIPTKDTAAGVAADSSQILIRPADSSLYVKYKRTWVKVGAGGTIGGSGTTNYLPKFTASTTLGNSQIFDNGTNVGVGETSPNGKLDVRSATGHVGINTGTSLSPERGNLYYTTDGTGWNLNIGKLQSGTFTPQMTFQDNGNVGINQSAPAGRFVVADGQTLLGTNTNNGVDRLQVSGSGYFNGSGVIGKFDGTSTNNAYIDFRTSGTPKWQLGNNAASSHDFNLTNSATSVNSMVVNSSNQIGFNMQGAFLAANSALEFHKTSSQFINRQFAWSSSGLGVTFDTRSTRSNTWGSYSATLSGDPIFQFFTNGSDNSAHRLAGFFGHYQDGSTTTTATPGYWTIESNSGSQQGRTKIKIDGTNDFIGFYTSSNGVNSFGGEKVRITSSGRVLMGSTLPTDNGTDALQVNGSIQGTGFNQAYLARTTTYTATTSDYFIDCTSGTFTVNLFTAVGNTGRILIIKNSGAGTITVDPNGAQTIDGAATQSLSTQWSRVHIISDGANWKIISN